jgi:hypothetical protein
LIDVFSEAMAVEVADGAVVILGPNGFAGSLTPEAAKESARRLLAAAASAARDDVDPPRIQE